MGAHNFGMMNAGLTLTLTLAPTFTPTLTLTVIGMMNAGLIYRQTQQFGNNGQSVNRLIVWRSNQAQSGTDPAPIRHRSGTDPAPIRHRSGTDLTPI